MDKLTAIFTTRPWNPVSYAIRMANPTSIFKVGPASHVLTLDGDTGYILEANMLHGVRRVRIEEAMKGLKEVARVDYAVPNAEAGLQWMRDTAARGAKYDWGGALALGLEPDRDWQQDDDWFCFEFHANGMAMAGRKAFKNCARVTSNILLSLNPEM